MKIIEELEPVYIAGSDGRDHFYGLFPKKIKEITLTLTKEELSDIERIINQNNTYGGYQPLLNKIRSFL